MTSRLLLLQVLLFCLSSASSPAAATARTTSFPIAKSGCQDRCGNVSVPYPFGIGKRRCYLDKRFKVSCNLSSNNPAQISVHSNLSILNYAQFNHSVLQVTLDYIRVLLTDPSNCYNKDTGDNYFTYPIVYENNPPFTFSYTRNKFTAIGCDIFAYITSDPNNDGTIKNYLSGCASFCNNKTVGDNHYYNLSSCSGYNGCCQTNVPTGFNSLYARVRSINTYYRSWQSNPCSYLFVVDQEFSGFESLNLTHEQVLEIPVILYWAIGSTTCKEAKMNKSSYVCGHNTECVESNNGPGYRCNCSHGYRGNPYLRHGCQDIDECKESNGRICIHKALCTNAQGSYICACPSGYTGDGRIQGIGCRPHKRKFPTAVVIALGIGIGIMLVLLLAFGFWLYRRLKEKRQIVLKQKYFKKNGGLLLKQKISSHDGSSIEKAQIFVIEELEKATDNFNPSRIIGKGGFGTVYKGMLSDGRIVAIKKSTLVNESQVHQFINEVAILSQIIQRHIVKLLGCCLETQVPLLVYEYVSNGTLSQHLHSEGYLSSISWKDRLRIAAEIARALAYLHSEASIPIFHRDIKSSNILLDESYRAKVCDFGLSRSVPIEKTHLTTLVRGTFGYLDPEYFHSGQFTDKSDVYSFGVVLVELLTGEKAVSLLRSEEEKGLTMYFISSMKENRLFEIIESRVVEEGDKDEVLTIAKLAKRCLKLNGKKRPFMKEVAASLEKLQIYQEQPLDQPKLQEEVGEISSCGVTVTNFLGR